MNNCGFGGCAWIIILIIILFGFGGVGFNNGCGCENNCGCNNGCGC